MVSIYQCRVQGVRMTQWDISPTVMAFTAGDDKEGNEMTQQYLYLDQAGLDTAQ